MNRARRTPHTRLRTRLGAGLGAALTTTLVASGAGRAPFDHRDPPAAPRQPQGERGARRSAADDDDLR